jgi:ribosome-associated protein
MPKTALPETSNTSEKPLVDTVVAALEDLKAQQIRVISVAHLSSLMDYMIVASGRSDRHVRAIAQAVVDRCKAAGHPPLGVEGEDGGEWVLVDLADVVVHVMLPRVREFYDIETLWEMPAAPEREERRS